MIRIKKPEQAPAILRKRGTPGDEAALRAVRLFADAYKKGTKSFTSEISTPASTARSPSRTRCARPSTASAPSASRRSHTSPTATSSISGPRRAIDSVPTGLSSGPAITGWPMSGRTSSSAAHSATRNSSATTSRSPTPPGGRRRTTTTSRRSSHCSSIPSSMIRHRSSNSTREYVRAIDGHPRGEATIKILGLNRAEIVEKRRDASRLSSRT